LDLIVIGQGYVGLPLAIRAAAAGYKVIGYDLDENKINKLKAGYTTSPDVSREQIIKLQEQNKIEFVYKLPNIKQKAIFVIAVPTPLNLNHKPDLSMLKNACQIVAKVVKDDSLIINESTSYIGTLRNLIKPTIDTLSGLKNLIYAVAPERIDPGNKEWDMGNTPRLISGLTNESTQKTINFYQKFCKELKSVSKPEVAEAAKLFENTFRQVNIALVNEFSTIADKFEFSTHEAINAAGTKPYGFMPFFPSIGVGGHCIPVDPTYLSYSAEKVGLETNLIDLANKINLSMAKSVAKRILVKIGGDLTGKRIQIAGIAYKAGVSDMRESPAVLLIEELKNLGARLIWCDPLVKSFNDEISIPLDPTIDLGLIVTPHEEIDFSVWLDAKTNVLDLSASPTNYGWDKFI
jgi:UDP-N-acetyl-D-glucosamine dehydrogenase